MFGGEFEDEKTYVKHETKRMLRQLLAFETVIRCLREYHPVSWITSLLTDI